MVPNSEFIDYLLELLQATGDIKVRAMFGGYGIYQHGIMFALVADDVLYLKTDENNLADFAQRGLQPFRYERNGKQLSMSYSEAPGEALDDADEMMLWAGKAIDAARRSAMKKHSRQ